MYAAVIIPAAGGSRRYAAAGGVRSKLDEDLGGRPVLQRTVELFTKRDEVREIVVVGPHDEAELAEFRDRHGDKLGLLGATLVRGGERFRWESVRAGLDALSDEAEVVAVHDGARPCTPIEVLDRVFEASASHGAVIPVVPAPDTIKRVDDEPASESEADPLDAILGSAGKSAAPRAVRETVPRDGLHLVQTPQVFAAGLLRRAFAEGSPDGSVTDEAVLVERLGEPVVAVEGDPRNMKLTTPADLVLIRAIAGAQAPSDRPAHKRF